jgi:hypothetical protein
VGAGDSKFSVEITKNGMVIRRERMAVYMGWKDRLDEVLPYAMVAVMLFYGCPLFMQDEGSSILFMVMVIPVGVFLCAFICGQRVGFRPLLTALIPVFYIPEYWVLLHDWEAWAFYAVFYTAFAFVGMTAGWGVQKLVKSFLEKRGRM